MRQSLAFAALFLPLAGCVVAPPPGPPPPYGYPQPAYAPDAGVYPGYAYNNGSPTLVVEGTTWPLVFGGGGWGYWDGYHRWHGAPGRVGGWLDARHPGGYGIHPYGGGAWGRPAGPGFGPGRGAYGPPGGFHPGGGGGFHPGGGGGFHPAAAGARPAAGHPSGGGGGHRPGEH